MVIFGWDVGDASLNTNNGKINYYDCRSAASPDSYRDLLFCNFFMSNTRAGWKLFSIQG
jgi:hypothetical protein